VKIIRYLIAVLLLLSVITTLDAATTRMYWATCRTGGGDCLDGIDGAGLVAGDSAIVLLDSGSTTPVVYFYRGYASSAAESDPAVIVPNANAGAFAWHLSNMYGGAITVTGNVTGANISIDNTTGPNAVCKASDGHIENCTYGTVPTIEATGTTSPGIQVIGIKSTATTGIVNITGPAAGATRVWTVPDANVTIPAVPVGTTDVQTLTNKTLTAPYITNAEVDGSATNATVSAAQVSSTFFHNCTQSAASTQTLPAAAVGYSFIATVCKPDLANAWKFAAYAGEYMTVDEVQGKTYVQRATTKVTGDSVTCWTAKQANDGMTNLATHATGSTVTKVAHAAFQFVIAGKDYTKAVDAAGTAAMTAETTPQNLYGAHALDIGVDGVVHATPPAATGNTTGYASAALAIAALPAVAAAHVRMGNVTAMRTNAAGFVWGTTGFNDAETTEAYVNTAVHTYGYRWNCKSGKTAWSTD
jgi:hypothetical protein